MKFFLKSKKILQNNLPLYLRFLLRWTALASAVGIVVGSSVAIFLVLLNVVTSYRMVHSDLIYLLPLGGLFIGLLYHYYGRSVQSGNHLLVRAYNKPQFPISLKMAPLILIGTLITHLFGGSAGREGTAVQIGGSIADQFARLLQVNPIDRKLFIALGISAGFAAVFGTPWAGTLFALEILAVGTARYKTVIPCTIAAFVAHYSCLGWSIEHSAYSISSLPPFTMNTLFTAICTGILFGIIALVFIKGTSFWSVGFKRYISYPPLRPFIGGLLFLMLFFWIGDAKYLGLGIPTIMESFEQSQGLEVFILKILFTSLTLGSGFKGGEVTPLFFIGATLGSFLSFYTPIPTSFLAGLGFVAVFAGATKAPWACTLMGIELFGAETAVYLAITCWTAALFSGRQNIYNSPPHPQLSKPYNFLYQRWQKIKASQSSSR